MQRLNINISKSRIVWSVYDDALTIWRFVNNSTGQSEVDSNESYSEHMKRSTVVFHTFPVAFIQLLGDPLHGLRSDFGPKVTVKWRRSPTLVKDKYMDNNSYVNIYLELIGYCIS